MFSAMLWIGRLLRPVLPSRIKAKIIANRPAAEWPARRHSRRVIFINSCTQGALMPSVDAAAAQVLDVMGVSAIVVRSSACCGAVAGHTGDHRGALDAARRNVLAWWPEIEAGAEAIVATASACGLQVRDYGRALADDSGIAAKARRVSELAMDLSEWLAPQVDTLTALMTNGAPDRVVFHSPCTLQHGLRRASTVEGMLRTLGADLVPVRDSHLCCGSAGTYSLLQPGISSELRDRKLQTLMEGQPRVILSANVGCLAHLESGAVVPVRHWIEWVAARMATPPDSGEFAG
jgi:glycolate oxidase iron-sulfur subunit